MRKTLGALVLAASMAAGLGPLRMSLEAHGAGAGATSATISPAGSLVGSTTQPPSSINLTTDGTTDWAHWGLGGVGGFDHKANGSSQIPTFAQINGGTLNPTTLSSTFSWSDGTPNATSSGTNTALSVGGIGRGFALTLPADQNARTVHLYVAVSEGQANLTASLSDGSAPTYSDSSTASFFGNRIQEYTLTYQAASPGQSLHLAFTEVNDYSGGTVSLGGASLSGGIPNIIVDTDMVTSVDDVGALAVVNTLTNQGQAKLVGVVANAEVNTTASIYTVGCVDAIDTYYGNNVPIGATLPITTYHGALPDFIFPCSNGFPKTFNYSQASPPPSALQVYRQTLAAQPDGSVVILSIGFEGNLSALLNSPGDGISPLTGLQLITKKVKMLMVMGGGYPSYPTTQGGLAEHNFRGDPNAAINIANNWPTKVVYSGYELGQDIGTGQNLCNTAPLTSPVRASYTIYTNGIPCNYYFSWDLTAAYHAILGTADPVMTEVGPGSNMIASDGTNTWITATNRNQFYLTAANHQTVADNLNALLAYNPGSAPGTMTPTGTATSTPTSSPTTTGTAVPGTATGTPTPIVAGGSLVGSTALPPSSINLTTDGTTDWAHWGLGGVGGFDHKANGSSQIPTFAQINGGTLNPTTLSSTFSWSDGTPNATSSGTNTAVSVGGIGRGFALTLPADQNARTVHLYVAVSEGQANLTASLSDGSAPTYSDSSTASFFGNRIQEYTLTYQAASPGQSLHLAFTEVNDYGGGTVSLGAASLSGAGPSAATATPTSTPTATSTAGGPSATSTSTSTTTATNTATATGTSTPIVANGSLVGSTALPPSSINLTADGPTDWAHWGLGGVGGFDHKANVTSQIPTFTQINGGPLNPTTLPSTFSWSDGTPNATSSGTNTAVSVSGIGRGFALTLPADQNARTVHLYVAVSEGQANLTASLSDGSAPTYSDSSTASFFGNRIQEYTLTYQAASPGQSLHLAFTEVNDYSGGTVSLGAASLN